MKLNNKGFAISVVLYAMVILVMGIMYLLLDIVNTRYRLSKETKDTVVEYINSQGINTISGELANKIAVNKIVNTGLLNYQNGNYYYNGNNPDNYIKFNNELWRIIGVFEIDGSKHLKLVRNDYLLQDSLDTNRIINSNIFQYLNSNYYNTFNNDKKYVIEVFWYNSEYSPNRTPFNAYNDEINTTNIESGYVGLINGSDFGFAASPSFITNNLSNYAISINQNWLATTYDYFTMSFSGTNINIVSNGNLVSTDLMEAYVYPVVYLNKDALISSGTGVEGDPYILG